MVDPTNYSVNIPLTGLLLELSLGFFIGRRFRIILNRVWVQDVDPKGGERRITSRAGSDGALVKTGMGHQRAGVLGPSPARQKAEQAGTP